MQAPESYFPLSELIQEQEVILLPVSTRLLEHLEAHPDLENELMEAHLQRKIIINILLEECAWQDTVLTLFETWPDNGRPLESLRRRENIKQQQQRVKMFDSPFEPNEFAFFREGLERLVAELSPFLRTTPEQNQMVIEIPYSEDLEMVNRENPLEYNLGDYISPDQWEEDRISLLTMGETVPILVGKSGNLKLQVETIPLIFLQEKKTLKVDIHHYPLADLSEQFSPKLVAFTAVQGLTGEEQDASSAVASASTILIIIPGLLKGMGKVPAFLENHAPRLTEIYDAILYFQYEHLHTSIEQASNSLYKALQSAGLHPEHNKTVVLVGLNTGGLIGRYLLEREGIKGIIHHLITIGTPNIGLAFPSIYITYRHLIAYRIATNTPHPKLLAYYKAHRTFDSKIFTDEEITTVLYADGYDPGIPYTLIAGDSNNQLALESAQASLKLLKGTNDEEYLYRITKELTRPNDGLCSTESMLSIAFSEEWEIPPTKLQVEASAFDYLEQEAVIEAILSKTPRTKETK